MKSLSIAIIDTLKVECAQRAVEKTLETLNGKASIEKVHWISNSVSELSTTIPVQFTEIDTIKEFPRDYNRVIFGLLPRVVQEDFVLIVQSDGYAVNSSAWTDAFLYYDYVGARWPWETVQVGNGGFSLRSRRLLDTIAQLQLTPTSLPEDFVICRQFRKQFEENGCVFAPPELADRFSIEFALDSPWLGHSLGFHGKVQSCYESS